MQDNHSRSARGVVRGMHFHVGAGVAKLVRCARGRILDVAVDLRRGSPTYAQWEGGASSTRRACASCTCRSGFAHGFCVLSEVADVLYKQTAYYDPAVERGIAWDDPEVGIDWPLPREELVVSERDARRAAAERDRRRAALSVASLSRCAPVSSACASAPTATRSRRASTCASPTSRSGALTLIVLTGAAVRLTGSGLGCPDWPKCYGNVYPPLNTHAVIEFSNRLITVPVSIAAGPAWLLALRRRPYRRDLVWLGALLPLGVVGQAVLGGFTVKGALDYGWVMGHFALSMLILLAAVVLAWRAGARAAASRERRCLPTGCCVRVAVRGLIALGALTIFAGTAATAAGPHAGGSPGQKINRLDFDGRGTMDFVIHRHAEIALVFGLAAVAVWWLARRRSHRSASCSAR